MINTPENTPHTEQAPMPASAAARGDQPLCRSNAITTVPKAMIEPTDKSIPPQNDNQRHPERSDADHGRLLQDDREVVEGREGLEPQCREQSADQDESDKARPSRSPGRLHGKRRRVSFRCSWGPKWAEDETLGSSSDFVCRETSPERLRESRSTVGGSTRGGRAAAEHDLMFGRIQCTGRAGPSTPRHITAMRSQVPRSSGR